MVIMASGIARGHERTTATTTTTELPKMAAILQKRDKQPWFTLYFFNIGHPC